MFFIVLIRNFQKILLLVFYLINISLTKESFSKISPNLLNIIECTPFAYGDFNADKLIDIYCVSNAGNEIQIWLAQDSFRESLKDSFKELFIKYKNLTINEGNVVNLIPGDFNGDSIIDLMVVFNKTKNYLTSRFYYGMKLSKNDNDISDANFKELPFNFIDQPLALDLNGDGILDLVGEDENGRSYYYFDEKGIVERLEQNESENGLFKGYSNSVIDLNNDYLPDLILVTKNNYSKPFFEIWMNNGNYIYTKNYALPNEVVYFGQSLFADFDSDGSLEHLLPACKDIKCENSTIYIYMNNEWDELSIDTGDFIFQPETIDEFKNNNIGISLKAGDYNLDGYLDLLIVMKDKKLEDKNNRYAVVLNNVPCTINDLTRCNQSFSRSFKIDLHINQLLLMKNVYLASFFDINDDGLLDIFILIKDDENKFHLMAFKNELYDDVYFLKVMVIPGRCDNECPQGTLPYGMNYPTPFIRIETESYEYKTFKLYSSQLSQSSHLALQLPYVIFGLGSTPNFVDRLTVGIGVLNKESKLNEASHKDWTSIIPNSQLVISVSPRDSKQYWKMQLFLTPSKNILLTFISLASTMVCLIIVIIFLQYREKKIDEKERKLESQKFHFDGL